ncbi:MAG TPA: histidine phosphatase family protein [Candidatus Binatia bacterium]|nr:histidine phosphatase family protein [Candidatus Binatia bacterium]
MGRLVLIRHGESEGNRDRVFTSTPDVSLTDAGRVQVRARADWVAERFAPHHIVSSPYARARETSAILAARLDVPVMVEEDLRERSYGDLAGRPYATIRDCEGYDPEAYWLWCPPGGETFPEVVVRTGAALDRIATAAPADDVVVVSHGAVMMALWKHVTGTWRAGKVARNAGVVVVEHDAGRWVGATAIDDG